MREGYTEKRYVPNAKEMSERRVYSGFFFAIFGLYLFVRPLYKHREYVYNWDRLNITMLVVLVVGSLLLVYLAFNASRHSRVWRIDRKLVLPLVTLVSVIAIQIIQTPHVLSYVALDIYLIVISSTIVGYGAFFIAGLIAVYAFDFRWIVDSFKLMWFVFTGVVLLNAFGDGGGAFRISSKYGVYLMMADSYAILSLLALSQIKGRVVKSSVFVAASIALIALMSRTSLYLFVVIGLVYLAATVKNKKIAVAMAIGLGSLVILLNSILGSGERSGTSIDIEEYGVEHRMVRVLLGEEDVSIKRREEMLNDGLESIRGNWLFGEFMGEIIGSRGQRGMYIHNILSYWRQYGIVVFFLFSGSLLYYYVKFLMVLANKKGSVGGYYTFLALYSSYCVLALLFSRSYMEAFPWFCISALPLAVGSLKTGQPFGVKLRSSRTLKRRRALGA